MSDVATDPKRPSRRAKTASWEERLKAAADAVRAADEAAHQAHEVRDHLIVAACDAHCVQKDVAHWSDITPSRVSEILADH